MVCRSLTGLAIMMRSCDVDATGRMGGLWARWDGFSATDDGSDRLAQGDAGDIACAGDTEVLPHVRQQVAQRLAA